MDVGYIRERLSVALARSLNAPVYRTSYGVLTINNVHYGFYIILENMDSTFLKSRTPFDYDSSAPWYKCQSKLQYYGNSSSQYNKSNWYDQKNEAAKDFTLLIEFLEIINNVNTTENDLLAIFDVDLFLRTYVMEVLSAQVDGLYNANNFFLAYNSKLSRWEYFRHDLDLSYGSSEGDPFFGVFIDRNIYQWADYPAPGYILPTKVLSYPSFLANYTYYMQQTLDILFNSSSYLEYGSNLSGIASAAAVMDNWHRFDLAWSLNEVQNAMNVSFTRTLYRTKITTTSIQEYINVRSQTAQQQLN